MAHWKRALRPIASLALLGAAASGCGLPDDGYYGGGWRGGGYYGPSSYYSPPSYHRSHQRADAYKPQPPRPRTENWSQDRLRQHWVEQAQKVR